MPSNTTDPNRSFFLPAAALLLMLMSAAGSEATVFRVDGATGADTPGCGSETSTCASIQQAVNLASSGDTILVAEGTYVYDAGLDPCTVETGVVCIVEKELTLVGGFASGQWQDPDPLANPTIIDGQDFVRGLLVKRSHPTSPSEASLRLEGFVIKKGLAGGSGLAPEDRSGGGLKAALVKSITLRDLVVEKNTAIGGDTTSEDGGNGVGAGIYISSSVDLPPTEVVLERVAIRENQAYGGTGDERGGFAIGAGMFINRADFKGSDLSFSDNSALAGNSSGDGRSSNGQSADALGGGLAVLAGTVVAIDGFSALRNSAVGGDSQGRGGVGAGGALYVERSSAEVRRAEMIGNSTLGGSGDSGGLASGGAVTTFAASITLERSALIENHATGGDGPTRKGSVGGGGAYFEAPDSTEVSIALRNCIVAANRVSLGTGGGVVGGGGGGVFVLGHHATLAHLTLAENAVGSDPLSGQALTVVPHPNGNPAHADVLYTIIANHTSTDAAAVQVRPGGSAHFERGLFANNSKNTDDGTLESGNYTGLDSMLQASSAGFVSPGSPDHDYHIVSSSPAVDQAVGSGIELDFDGQMRPSDRDIGADEHCSAAVENLTLSDEVVTGSVLEQACSGITADHYTVTSTGSVLLQAGERVVLGNGLQIDTGGELQVVISLP